MLGYIVLKECLPFSLYLVTTTSFNPEQSQERQSVTAFYSQKPRLTEVPSNQLQVAQLY